MKSLNQLGVEAFRLRLLRGLDDALLRAGFCCVAGVDEAGRGCLAGPVVAAAVVVDESRLLPGIDDSKLLKPQDRELLSGQVRSTARAWAVGSASASEIDRLNILRATKLAMRRALDGLVSKPDCALVDAVHLEDLGYPCIGLVRADLISYSVACASILAKVERDRLMVEMDGVYPQYGFSRHKGYAAAEHRQALIDFGPSPLHRLTFRSVVPRLVETVN